MARRPKGNYGAYIWFRANKLSLNLKKTKFMVFKPSQKRKSHDIQLLINDYKLDQVKETIFLLLLLFKKKEKHRSHNGYNRGIKQE